MPVIRPQYPVRLRVVVAGLLAAILTAGCATSSVAPSPIVPKPEAHTQSVPGTSVPVVRYGRYTLVELAPDAAQRDLLLQVVDVSMPATLPATVGDAFRYVLLRSGYRLCENDAQADALYELPLPAAHLNLGPLTLRDALLTLAGPAWDLRIDDGTRSVCFARRVDDAGPSTHPVPVLAEPTGTAIPSPSPEALP